MHAQAMTPAGRTLPRPSTAFSEKALLDAHHLVDKGQVHIGKIVQCVSLKEDCWFVNLNDGNLSVLNKGLQVRINFEFGSGWGRPMMEQSQLNPLTRSWLWARYGIAGENSMDTFCSVIRTIKAVDERVAGAVRGMLEEAPDLAQYVAATETCGQPVRRRWWNWLTEHF